MESEIWNLKSEIFKIKIRKAMISSLLGQATQILRGKNGSVYFMCMVALMGIFALKILPKIIWLVAMSFIVFLIFRMFEKKRI